MDLLNLSAIMLLASTVFGDPHPLLLPPLSLTPSAPCCHQRLESLGSAAPAAPSTRCCPAPSRSSPVRSKRLRELFLWKPSQLMRHIACNFSQRCCTCGCLVTSPPPFGRATCRDARHSRFAALREGRPDGPDRTGPGCLKEPTMGTGTPEPTPLGESAGSPVISPELTECSLLADKSSCGFCFKVAAIVT